VKPCIQNSLQGSPFIKVSVGGGVGVLWLFFSAELILWNWPAYLICGGLLFKCPLNRKNHQIFKSTKLKKKKKEKKH
jgi:hypothetical protein